MTTFMAKIVLLSPYFNPALAFQEWVLAKYLARAGHAVTVVSSPEDLQPERNARLLTENPGIVQHRVPCWHVKDTLFPKNLRRIRELCAGQDAAVINAPGHGFGYRALKALPRDLKAVVCFGDLTDNRSHMNPLVKWVKDRWYRWLFERADRITYNTPECPPILCEAGLGKHKSRIELVGLPHDEDFFFLDEAHAGPRPAGRVRTLTTITRPMAHKPFDKWLPPIFDFLRSCPDWRYCLAGLADDAPSQQVRSLVAESGLAGRIELLPMQDQSGMCRLYNEADLGLFPRATIGIQQAMATGLPVILPQRLTVSHLVREGHNGSFYDNLATAGDVFIKAARHEWPARRILAGESGPRSGASYPGQILKGLL